MIKQSLRLLFLLLTLLFTIGCGGGGSQASNSGGSGSEIVGVVQTTDEESTRMARAFTPSDSAFIFLLGNNYVAVGNESPDTETEPDGSFGIDYAAPGQYILEAYDLKAKKSKAAVVNVSGDGRKIDLGKLTVEEPASINCTINTNISGVTIEYYVYVLGTRVWGKGDEKKLNLTLSNIPIGVNSYTIKLKVTKPLPIEEEKTVTITSGGSIIDLNFDLPL